MSDQIKYREGYKYQLAENYGVATELRPPKPIRTPYIWLSLDGVLTVRKGYAWDGPSGPAIDTKNFMRGSLVHDALYQFLREGKLPQAHRETADRLLQAICIEDGMTALRSWWVYQGVRFGGGPAADPDNDNPILIAP